MALCALFFLYLTSAQTQFLTEPVSKDNSPICDCYLTSGPDPSYFQYHRFWDFRSIASTADDDYSTAPPLITPSEDAGFEALTSSYFNATAWNADWSIQSYATNSTVDSPIVSVNSLQNVYISRNTSDPNRPTYLTLRASRLPSFMSIAELDSNQKNLLHSSIRARLRVIPNGLSTTSSSSSSAQTSTSNNTGSSPAHPVDGGAVAGLFTYHSSTEESDIEILTRDPTDRIRYSNQPDFNYHTGETIPGASTDDVQPDGLVWTEWLDHRIDWLAGVSRWYLNGELVLNKSENVPTSPSGLVLNLWGDGGEWSGNMTVGGLVVVGVEWVEMVFNVSGPVDGGGGGSNGDYGGGGKRSFVPQLGKKKKNKKEMEAGGCQVGCNVDGVQRVGFPEVVFNSTTSAAASLVRGLVGGCIGMAGVVIALAVLSVTV